MKISYKWLCEILPGLEKIEPLDLAHQLTMSGLEIEGVLDQKQKFKGLVVGLVEKKEKHPKADKLSLCQVSTGSETFQVVCGAKNVAAGQKFPFATLGTIMPSGLEIKPIQLRGIESSGMLCSAAELELSQDSNGLWRLPDDLKPGQDLSEALGLDDCIFEVNVTPNRGDALSHWGIAKDVAALTHLKPDFTKVLPNVAKESLSKTLDTKTNNSDLKILLEDQSGCPRYTASFISGVKIAPSPQWLQSRLESLGLRAINNVVDATNYIMILTGHPVHAFDAKYIKNHTIKIKTLNKDMSFKTLDETERKLLSGDLVVCDEDEPKALAGIMGGLNSGVEDQTTDLILEVAFFDPDRIRKTSRRLGLQTDSSYRFARFVNPDSIVTAHELLQNLIVCLAGGTVSQIRDFYPKPYQPLTLQLNFSELQRILGIDIPKDDIKNILESLSLTVENHQNSFEVTVPVGRSDLTRPIDLVEEVGRIYGLDKIAEEMPRLLLRRPIQSSVYNHDQEIKDFFIAKGFVETIHMSFGDQKYFEKTLKASEDNFVKLQNPLSEDLGVLRPSLLPQLLECYKKNYQHSQHGLKFFELRKVYNPKQEGYRLSFLYGGNPYGRNRFGYNKNLDFYYGKGLMKTFFDKARINLSEEVYSDYPYHPGQALCYRNQNQVVASLGALHPELLQKLKIKDKLYFIDVDFDWLMQNYKTQNPSYKEFSALPAVYRDLALVCDQKLTYSELLEAISQNKPQELQNVHLFDVYEGEAIPEGTKSFALSLIYEPKNEALTDDFVNEIHFKLVDKLKDKLDLKLR